MDASTVIEHRIGGRGVSTGGAEISVSSPVDGRPMGHILSATPDMVEETVAAARKGFEEWRAWTVKDRVQPLFQFKQLAEGQLESLSELCASECGKTHAEARAELEKGIEVVEFATSAPQLLAGELLEVSNGVDCFQRRYPLGVVLGITPFNFPGMVPMWMWPLAIVSGNAFILKPSEQVPITSVRIADLLAEAGLPAGVFNVLHGGRETVEALLDHPGIAAAAFVGSTPVARAVYQRGIAANKRVLALGGAKNHLVVVPDADPEIAARNIVSSVTGCAGQRCMAASVLVTVGDCGTVMERIAAEMRKIQPGINMGAIINPRSLERIRSYIDQAERDGAKIAIDGRDASVPEKKKNGNYIGASMIDGITPDSPAAREEIFGPVLSVLHTRTLDEAIAIENANPYGNAASIYTSSGAVARYFEMRASAGMIGVNIGVPVPREPFAFGGWNDSKFGAGDITGRDGLSFWSMTKKITEKWTAGASRNWMS